MCSADYPLGRLGAVSEVGRQVRDSSELRALEREGSGARCFLSEAPRILWYSNDMDKKTVVKKRLQDITPSDDLAYWLSRPPSERLAAVETLRRQHYGHAATARLQRVARVIQRTKG